MTEEISNIEKAGVNFEIHDSCPFLSKVDFDAMKQKYSGRLVMIWN